MKILVGFQSEFVILSECDTDAKCAILRQGKRDWIRTFMKKQLENENPLFCPTE